MRPTRHPLHTPAPYVAAVFLAIACAAPAPDGPDRATRTDRPGPPGSGRLVEGQVVAVTIDDLPFVGGRALSLDEGRRIVERIVRILEAHDVPASGFVTGGRARIENESETRRARPALGG